MQVQQIMESRARLMQLDPDLRGMQLSGIRGHVQQVYKDAMEAMRRAARLEAVLSEHERHVDALRSHLLDSVEPLYPRYTAYFRGTMEDLITDDGLSIVPQEVCNDVTRETKDPRRLTFEHDGVTRELHTTANEFATPLLIVLGQLGLPKTGVRYRIGDHETRNASVVYLDGGQWSTSSGRMLGSHVDISRI